MNQCNGMTVVFTTAERDRTRFDQIQILMLFVERPDVRQGSSLRRTDEGWKMLEGEGPETTHFLVTRLCGFGVYKPWFSAILAHLTEEIKWLLSLCVCTRAHAPKLGLAP